MDEGNHSIRWFLYDKLERVQQGRQWEIDSEWLTAIWNSLEQCNPYLQSLQTFASVENIQYSVLELSAPSSGGDFAAIAHIADSTAFHPRNIVIWRNTDRQPSFIPLLSKHYKPLQYPVLFPHGTPGWGLQTDGTGWTQNRYGLTQTQFYRSRILTEPRFLQFGRVANEYFCDMWSRVQEENLSYIYQGRAQQFRNQNPELAEDATFDVHLSASFLGSCEWTSDETANSLALARHFGCGTLFITMTTNTKWD
jgi:hypothetical protein